LHSLLALRRSRDRDISSAVQRLLAELFDLPHDLVGFIAAFAIVRATFAPLREDRVQ